MAWQNSVNKFQFFQLLGQALPGNLPFVAEDLFAGGVQKDLGGDDDDLVVTVLWLCRLPSGYCTDTSTVSPIPSWPKAVRRWRPRARGTVSR